MFWDVMIRIPLPHANSSLFSVEIIIALGDKIWICHFLGKVLILKPDKDDWKRLAVVSYHENRLEAECFHSLSILLERLIIWYQGQTDLSWAIFLWAGHFWVTQLSLTIQQLCILLGLC